jgi:hypothetical protein
VGRGFFSINFEKPGFSIRLIHAIIDAMDDIAAATRRLEASAYCAFTDGLTEAQIYEIVAAAIAEAQARVQRRAELDASFNAFTSSAPGTYLAA